MDFKKSEVPALDMDSSDSNSFSGTLSGVTSTHAARQFQRTNTGFTKSQQHSSPSKFLDLAKNFVLAALFLGGLYYLFVPQSSEDYSESAEFSSEAEVPQEIEQKPLRVEPTFTFMVNSRPSKAQIIINGKDTNVQTPGIVRVPQKKRFTLELRKRDYITFIKDYKLLKNGQKAKPITMQRELVGYVNIAVAPSSAIIYVNGEKLNQTPPIKGYAVPAGTRISIKAVNPFSQTEDEKLVIVDRDQTKNVVLKLHKKDSPRQPSGRQRRR